MPPPGHEPFLRAICENPADDAPRLVYADWLEENGDPERAEFVRVQIERAAALVRREDRPDLLDRDRHLRQLAEARWRAELPAASGVNWQRFWRGFVAGAIFDTGRAFLHHADAVTAAAPIQFVRLHRLSDQTMGLVSGSPALDRVEELTIVEPVGISWKGWQAFAVAARFGRLQRLSLEVRPRGSFGPAPASPVLSGLAASCLAESPGLTGVREILVCGPLDNHAITLLRTRFGSVFRHVHTR